MNHSPATAAIDPDLDMLTSFSVFDSLNREDRLVLETRAERFDLGRGKVLFKHGDCDPWMYLLVEGELALKAGDGRMHRVSAGSPEAGRVISRLKPRLHTATAVGPVSLIRIDDSGIGFWHTPVDAPTMHVAEIENEEYLAAGGTSLQADADFELPSLPLTAMKARDLISRDDCDAATVARLLMNDPSMTAKLIRAANSPVFYGTQGVSTCEKAIVRLGFKTTRHLIVAFAVRQLFDFDSPQLDALVRELWDHSTEVAAIASVLARHTRAFDPGEAQLAGLLHDLGVIPILDAAARSSALSEDPEAILAMIAQQRAAMGQEVLQRWLFPEAMVTAAAEAENWHRDGGEKADLADVVIVAQLLSFIGKQRILDVPPVVSVPAFRKLLGEDTSPADVMQLLEESEQQIDEIRSLLRS